ncbi:MAG: GAF domain-containing protein [Magnetococcales bacterium]|nr:GAF domain-containing protein [Magnetococcales bacterium]
MFFGEFLIMLVVEEGVQFEQLIWNALLDAALVTGLALPTAMFLFVRPLQDKHATLSRTHVNISTIFDSTSRILRHASQHQAMKVILKRILDELTDLPWLSIESKGSIFITASDGHSLNMVVETGLHTHLLAACSSVPFGHCHCGQAAATRKLQFSNCVDHRHTVTFDGMTPHGHYCLPILSGERVLGVLNLYIPEGHALDETETTFLGSVATIIASVIERSEAQDALVEYNRTLEEKVEQRAEELKKNYEIQSALNAVLGIANDAVNLTTKMNRILNTVMDVPWLAVENRGCMFLAEQHGNRLTMETSRGMGSEVLKCQSVPYGHCLCGKAAQEKKMVFKSSLDADHHESFDGMTPHGHYCIPFVSGDETLGLMNLYVKDDHQSDEQEVEFLNAVGHAVSGMIQRHKTEEKLANSTIHLGQVLSSTVMALSQAAEKRDPYTAGHQNRVALLAVLIGERLGFNRDQLETLRMAGVLHDIGKIIVPAEILSKPGKLTKEEFSLIKGHSEAGYEILKTIPFQQPIADIVRQHHEKLDGSGYPLGIMEPDFLPESKVLAVADMMEALASHRPYRPSMGVEKARSILLEGRGKYLCPDAVDACNTLIDEFGDFERMFIEPESLCPGSAET